MESLSRGRRVQRGVWEKERQFNRVEGDNIELRNKLKV